MGSSSIVALLNYADEGNFTFDSTQIEFVTASARLKLQESEQVFSQDFASDVGFTYDNGLIEFVGGVMRQKSQRPANALLHNKFATKDANWSSGSPTGTLVGTATVAGGVLALNASNDNYLQYAGAGNLPTGNTGCVRFRFRPNYSGSPTGSAYLFSMSAASNNIQSLVRIQQIGTLLRIDIYDSAGVSILTSQTGNTFNPVAGTWYEIELNWDTTTSAHRLFIDGVLLNGTKTGTGTMGARTVFRLGKDYTSSVTDGLDGDIDDLVIYDAPQHTANYTPGAVLPDTDYVEAKADLPTFVFSGVGSIVSVIDGSIVETDSPKFILMGRYWNGTNWVSSDGTYAQATDFATAAANFPSFPIGGETTLPVSVVFQSSNIQGSIDSFSATVVGTTNYPASAKVTQNSGILMDALEKFEESDVTKPANTALTYTLKWAGQEYYWNGTAVVASNGTVAQTNSAATILAQKAAFTTALGLGANVSVVAYLATSDGLETPILAQLTVGYNFYSELAEPATCTVWGFYRDISGIGVPGANVTFKLKREAGQYREAGSSVIEKKVTVVTDANGRFEVDLIRSSEFQGGSVYQMEIKKTSDSLSTIILNEDGDPIDLTVPDSADVNVTELITAV